MFLNIGSDTRCSGKVTRLLNTESDTRCSGQGSRLLNMGVKQGVRTCSEAPIYWEGYKVFGHVLRIPNIGNDSVSWTEKQSPKYWE